MKKIIYPKAKRNDRRTIDAKHFHVICASFKTRNGFAHECTIYPTFEDGIDFQTANGLQKWYNRTWENFKYECAIRDAIEELPKELQKMAEEELIESQKIKTHEECESFLDAFKKEYDQLPDRMKESMKNITITNEEQAKSTLALMKLGNLMIHGIK